ncbi:MAG: cytochrome c [Polyangiaceae bacterium]|nr:cytochrome c [Polyangiaceae bacterium]
MNRVLLLVGAFAIVGGCSADAPAPQPAAGTPKSISDTEGGAVAALDRMDARTPVPLLPMMANHQKENMRDHLFAVQEIIAALATDDFAAIERTAGRIGFSESMGKTCTHMGAGAPGFTEQAIGFHRAADRIAAAAREGDRTGVLTELNTTLKSCVSCHAAWKQQVVDEPTWERLTSSGSPPH